MMVSPSIAKWADRDPRRGSRFCRLSLQTSHPAGVDPDHCPAFGTGELQENGTGTPQCFPSWRSQFPISKKSAAVAGRKSGLFRFWLGFCRIRRPNWTNGARDLAIARADPRLSGVCWKRSALGLLVFTAAAALTERPNWQPKHSRDWQTSPADLQNTRAKRRLIHGPKEIRDIRA